MQIVGIIENSFVDYPGKIATVLFAPVCNWNCYYCHNRDIIREKEHELLYSTEMILANLQKKRGFIDGVVISGGEPTLHSRLPAFLREIKGKTALAVKLDTNGTNPFMLKTLIDENLVDYIAMDIKAPKAKYASVIGVETNFEELEKSINIIKNSGTDYEFRTTFCPRLEMQDILQLAKEITPAKTYALQQYRKPEGVSDDEPPPYEKEYIIDTAKKIEKYFEKIIIRGV